jgi:cytoskeletal protein RodZ
MPESIGQQLKKARLARNLTIEEAVEATRIRAYYLEAIEDDNFEVLPSPVQARGFLRAYADYLGCSLDELIEKQAGSIPEMLQPPTAKEAIAPGTPNPQSMGEPPAPSQPAKKNIAPTEPPAPQVAHEQPLTLPVAPPDEVQPPLTQGPSERTARSQVIFTAIGRELRDRRESLSLTLEEVEHHIHVRKHSLQALEAGEFDKLPSSVQTRGMLNNYARFLDIDVEALLLQYADGLQAQLLERQQAPAKGRQPTETKSKSRLPFKVKLPSSVWRYFSTDVLAGGGLILFLLIFAIWGTNRVINLRAVRTPLPTAPSISDFLIASPAVLGTSTATSSPVPSGPAVGGGAPAAVVIPTNGPGQVHIVLVALESTWVRVVVDQRTIFEGRITSGTAYPYDGANQIEVLTGNAAAVDIVYNQKDMGSLGGFGEVIDRIYTANAVLTPTGTFTPTFTQTPVPSPTPRTTPIPLVSQTATGTQP